MCFQCKHNVSLSKCTYHKIWPEKWLNPIIVMYYDIHMSLLHFKVHLLGWFWEDPSVFRFMQWNESSYALMPFLCHYTPSKVLLRQSRQPAFHSSFKCRHLEQLFDFSGGWTTRCKSSPFVSHRQKSARRLVIKMVGNHCYDVNVVITTIKQQAF